MNKEDLEAIKTDIVQSALAHVPFDGWTLMALETGAVDAGYEPSMVRAVFISPVKDAIAHFAALADEKMLHVLDGVDAKAMRIRDKISVAVMARFEFLAQHKEAYRLAVQYGALPTRKPGAIKNIWRSADVIWDWAGDVSQDYNRYTKRGLLSAVMASTALAFLSDESEDLRNTKTFLDRRIENVMQFNKVISKYKKAS